jgi:hypothetical protein
MDDLLHAAAVLAGFMVGGAVPTWWTLRTRLPEQPARERALFIAFWPVGWLLLARARYRTLMEHNDKEVL